MEKADIGVLIRRAVSDPVFRQRLLADPEVAVREAGWDLPPDDMTALKEWHATMRNITKISEIEQSLTALATRRCR